MLIAKPAAGVSTAEAYRKFDSAPSLNHPNNRELLFLFARGEYRTGLSCAGNLFEQLAHVPEGARIKSAMRENGAYYAAMSGSGSAFFGLFENEADAARAEAALRGGDLFTARCKTADRVKS